MSNTSSPRKQPPSSPVRNKRKAPESAGPSRRFSTSPYPHSNAGSSTPSPQKRTSRRGSRQPRTFRIAESIDGDEDVDAPYEEDDVDAEGDEDEEYNAAAVGKDEPTQGPSSSTNTGRARPRRTNAPTSYYVPPAPGLSDEEDGEEEAEETPSIRRRARKTYLPSSDIDEPPTPGRSRPEDTAPAKPKPTEQPEELSEEAKTLQQAEKEAEDLRSRWTEEYFEIVEQLPLEMHRTFALMRELEGQMHARVNAMTSNIVSYRDARLDMQRLIESPFSHSGEVREGSGSEHELETLLGGSQEREGVMDKATRQELLRSISQAATESVKAAEEKMGLAATAYNWIDRHIRRLDSDIAKLESSILLGLRTGTEESRGAREALGLPVDDEQVPPEDAEEAEEAGVSAEAESASLTKAAGAARRSIRRKSTASPRNESPTPLAASPRTSRSRSPAARKKKPQPRGRRTETAVVGTVGPDTSDMPVDPNEPCYCYCHQVSFGEMVACENDDCKMEWFHFGCVGLSSQPKGKWYCRFHAPKGWKGEGTGVPPNATPENRPPGWKKGVGIKP